MPALAINRDRLWSDLMTLGCLGATPRGGSDRLSLTDADRDARNLFVHWCAEAGLAVTIDAMGNVFGRREGADPSLPPVLAGSHLDTQQPGGKFDGPLGVLAALAAVRAMNAAGIVTQRAVEVVNWTNEEGARFAPGLMGSGVFAGKLDLAATHATADRGGATVGAELARIGYRGAAPCGGRAVDSYFELHIEQGPVLEAAGRVIGAVTGSHYMLYLGLECLGENGHAQSLPQARRRNALYGASRLVAEIEAIGDAHAPAGTASAITMDVWPNNRINIAHRAVFAASVVHPAREGVEAMEAAILAAMARIADETGLALSVVSRMRRDPIVFDAGLAEETLRLAAARGHSAMPALTRPGHDAFNLSAICPTALIFVPCLDGVSHSELERASLEHCAAGAEILLDHMLNRAGRAN